MRLLVGDRLLTDPFEVAAARLLVKFHHETDCGMQCAHWAECEALADALGIDPDELVCELGAGACPPKRNCARPCTADELVCELGSWGVRDHVGAEEAARAMSGAQRRAYLVARGWRRLGRATWLRPTFDAPGGDRGFYSLAAAVRVTLIEERG